MKNRILTLLIATLLAVTFLPSSAFAKNSVVRAEQVIGKQGETVSVSIRLENNSGLVALQLKVSYDNNALSLTEVVDGAILNGKNHGKNLAKNPYTLDWNDDTAEYNNTGDGVIVMLRFTIAENAVAGSYPITVSVKECWNADMEAVGVDAVSGSVTVASTQSSQIVSLTRTSSGAVAVVSCDDASASVYCATYDGAGRMLGVFAQSVCAGKNSYTFAFGSTACVRVFVLKNGVPLCASLAK